MSAERRLFVLLLCAPLLGFIGIMAAEAVPDTRIADHLLDGERGGIIGPSDPGPTPLGTTAAFYSECTAFSVGLGDPPGQNRIAAAMLGTAYTGCERLPRHSPSSTRPGSFGPDSPIFVTGTGMPSLRDRRSGSSGLPAPVGSRSPSWLSPWAVCAPR